MRTSDTVAASGTERHEGSARRSLTLRRSGKIRRSASSARWLGAAAVTAAIALASVAHARVPLASGAAVAVLTIAALVDIRDRRLPDVIVIVAALTFAILTVVDAAVGQADPSLGSIAAGMAAFGGPLLALHLVAPASMGFGDVKTSIVLGAAIGAVDWQLALAALALAAGVTATVGLITRASTIAFGPGLVAASAVVLAAHPAFLTEPPRVDTPSLRPDITATGDSTAGIPQADGDSRLMTETQDS